MQDIQADRKTSVELAVDRELIERAAAHGVDVADVLERALERELGSSRDAATSSKRAEDWRRENADAIKSWNDELDRNGLWSDGLRSFCFASSTSVGCRGGAAVAPGRWLSCFSIGNSTISVR